MLVASPDGLVGNNAIIDVECPYAFRNDHLFQKLKNTYKYIISYKDDGEIIINLAHKYQHQIQRILHIWKKLKCYMFIQNPNEDLTVINNFDFSWEENIPILKTFYIDQYLPQLLFNEYSV